MENQRTDYQAIRRQIACRMRRRLVFFIHVGLFLATVLACLIDRQPLKDVVILTLFWLPFLLAHGFVAFGYWGRIVDHYTRRELEQIRAYQKPKRSDRVRLTDDGELLADDDELEAPWLAKKRSQ